MKGTRKRPRTGFRKWLYEFLTDTYTYRKGDGPLVTVSGHRHYSVDPVEVLYILAKRGDLDGIPGFSKKTAEEKPDKTYQRERPTVAEGTRKHGG